MKRRRRSQKMIIKVISIPLLLLIFLAALGFTLHHHDKVPSEDSNQALLPVGQWWDITIDAENIIPTDRSTSRDNLAFLGGIVLTSDSKEFGGISGFRINPEKQQIIGVSDSGLIFEALYTTDSSGVIDNLYHSRLASLMRSTGQKLVDTGGDAEGVELFGDDILISFERYHRIDQYSRTPHDKFVYKSRLLPYNIVKDLQPNRGLESIALLRDSRVLTIAEDIPQNSAGIHAPGWISQTPIPNALTKNTQADKTQSIKWDQLHYLPAEDFALTDIIQDKSIDGQGDIYGIERAFSKLRGIRIRIVKIKEKDLIAGAILKGEEIASLSLFDGIDNMEGIDIQHTADGRLLLYIISDNNFNFTQRNILLTYQINQKK